MLKNKASNSTPQKEAVFSRKTLLGHGWYHPNKWDGMILLKQKGREDTFKITAVILKLNGSLSLHLPLQHIIEAISLPHYQRILL